MEPAEAAAYTENCISGEPAPCVSKCPFRLDVRQFLGKTSKRKWNSAYKTLRTAVVFPAIVGALCPAPCENECLRAQTGDEPVAVRMIEDACVSLAENKRPEYYVIPPKTQRAAIIGAGVAGLSAALCLAQKKYPVTVYDSGEGWGGSLRSHPRFSEFDADITMQFSVTEAEFIFNTSITSLEGLTGYDLIYVATGSGGDSFGLLGGWDPDLLTTAAPGIFIGGALTGADLPGSVVQGKTLSKTAEVFLQTGKAAGESGAVKDRVCRPDYSGAPSVRRAAPAGQDGYTADEAETESLRCFQCDCEKCVASCEMLNAFRKKPKKIALEVLTDTKVTPPYSTHTLTRQAYSCNMCGHCKAVCPEDIDVGALLQASRAARTQDRDYPAAMHDFWLREMDFMTGEASFFIAPGVEPGYVFFPGCQLGAHDPEYVYKSYEFLHRKFNAGIFAGCCGAPAYWAGDAKRQTVNFDRIREVWKEAGEPAFVFACATCESMFGTFLPEIRRESLYGLLDADGGAAPALIFNRASVFDPCNARKNPETELAVRALARKSGAEISELPEKNRCCGYGGHMRTANPNLYDSITEKRAGMGEHPYIVYCVNCREVFMSRGKESAHILDVVFDLSRAENIPRIDEKHNNAIKVKMELNTETGNADPGAAVNEWDSLDLIVDDSLAESIDRKLIALSDIREAVWLAEKTGDKFVDEADGVCQCSMEKAVLTYWVQYKKTDSGAYEVFGAYYHRMRIGGGDT